MARPRRSHDTRATLIQEGIAQLSTNGYHGTGIKQILDAVKVPKGSFYNYFDSKEAFVAEIVKEYSQAVMADLEEAIASCPASPTEKITAIFSKTLDKLEGSDCEQGCLVGSLAAEIGHNSDLCRQAMHQAAGRWEERIAELVAQGQELGEIRTDIPSSELTRMLWSCWEGALIRMKMEGNATPARQVIALMPRTILTQG